MRQLIILILLFVLAPAIAAKSNGYKVEPIGALTDEQVAETVRGALESTGLRIVGEDGKPLCEIWLRAKVPVGKNEISGAFLNQVTEGTLIGVINFLTQVTDFRGQGIKAGYYTLRYAAILADGNHLGVSVYRDFVLLSPVAQDKDPNAQLTAEEMIKLSRSAAGTNHPSPWSLVPATSSGKPPQVIKNEVEHVILELTLKTSAGEIPIGLTLVGKAEG